MEEKFSKEKFSDSFRSSFIESGDALSRQTLILALGSHVVAKHVNSFWVTPTGKGDGKVNSKDRVEEVFDHGEIMVAINSLVEGGKGSPQNPIKTVTDDLVTETTYYVIEKRKPEWRAAQALWEHELGRARTPIESKIDAKVEVAPIVGMRIVSE